MHQPAVSSKTVFSLSLGARIGIACLMFAVSLVSMWSYSHRLEWVPWFCFGLYYLTYVPREKGEAVRTHFQKPRSIAQMALLLVALAGFGYNLYVLFMKHFG